MLIKDLIDINDNSYIEKIKKLEVILPTIEISSLIPAEQVKFTRNLMIFQILAKTKVLKYLDTKIFINKIEKNLKNNQELIIDYYRSLGEIYNIENKYDKAIEMVEKILKINYDV